MINTVMVSSQYSLEAFPHFLRLKSLSHWIHPYIGVAIETTRFQVKTAMTAGELAEVLKLRFQVFQQEFSGEKPSLSLIRYDIDCFDFKCDHLIVKEKSTGKVVAAYRLLAHTDERPVQGFYSESEFHIAGFLSVKGNKVELGRACVHKDYRNGEVISLLWKGLCSYAKKAEAKYLFGCSSITQTELPGLTSIISQLERRGALIDDGCVFARSEYSMGNMPLMKEHKTDAHINSLMNMYLLAGAKMSRNFAYDAGMKCVDVFTMMDMDKMPVSFVRRFAC